MIYLLGVDTQYVMYMTEDEELEYELTGLFTGEVQLPSPEQLPVRLVPGYGDAKKQPDKQGDIHKFSAAQLLFSKKAVDALGLEEYGDLYPMYLVERDETFYWFWSTVVIDCLDHDKTIWATKLKLVDEPVFDDEKIEDTLIFTLPHDQKDQMQYFVTERFKELVVKAKLKGIALKTGLRNFEPWVS
uniref:hypothetical protein n=1 Tax=Thaumasiovibrio occultus TaxID=1891184 RepID=UPI000B360111|nr:hypothetical protein [Thaumasiovibrio occultus]